LEGRNGEWREKMAGELINFIKSIIYMMIKIIIILKLKTISLD